MKAMVSALASGVSESAFGRWWVKFGDVVDCAIPLAFLVAILAAFAVTILGLVPAPQP